jgi:hypothetical protein
VLADNGITNPPSTYRCNLVAIGSDRINTSGARTGLGTFDASIDLIIEIPDNNAFDGPEFVIETIKVTGDMDFTPAFLNGLPFGTITGQITSGPRGRGRGALFSGTFRLPFTPFPGGPFLYLDTIDGQPNIVEGQPVVIPIQTGELSLTLPLVRFEVWFE